MSVFGFHLDMHFLSIRHVSQFQCFMEAYRNSRIRARAQWKQDDDGGTRTL
jgi:hypothetical protein